MTRLKQLKGFTLIELIVVVIIIGVLAAIAAVAYNTFVANSRTTALTASATQASKKVAADTAQSDTLPSAYISNAALNANLGLTGDVFVKKGSTNLKMIVLNSKGVETGATRAVCVTWTTDAAGEQGVVGTPGTPTYAASVASLAGC